MKFLKEFQRNVEEYERLIREYDKIKRELQRVGLRAILYAVKIVGSVEELARLSEVSPEKIRKILNDGFIKTTKLNRDYVLGLREVIDRFVQGKGGKIVRIGEEVDRIVEQ